MPDNEEDLDIEDENEESVTTGEDVSDVGGPTPTATGTPQATSGWVTSGTPVEGGTGEHWFDEQQYSGLTVHGMLFELIDNSIQHRVKLPKDKPLTIHIDVHDSSVSATKLEKIVITDNAGGMEHSMIGKFFSPYHMANHWSNKDSDSLSEHGIGMKTAIRGLGSKHEIFTRADGESKTTKITTEDIRKIPGGEVILPQNTSFKFDHGEDHGTMITITDLETKARDLGYSSGKQKNFEKAFLWAVGQRYRNFLMQKYLNSSSGGGGIYLRRFDSSGKEIFCEEVGGIYPHYYFNPSKNNGKPWFKNHPIESDDGGVSWKAKFTMGWAPRDKDEYAQLGISPPIQSHPYYVSGAYGFDIVRNGIVIQPNFFKQVGDEPGIVKGHSNVHTRVRGEIILVSGFSSKKEKTGVYVDDNWASLVKKISQILNGEIDGPKPPDFKTTASHTKDWMDAYVDYKPPPDKDLDEKNYRIGVINFFNDPETKPNLSNIDKSVNFPKIIKAEEHVGTGVGQTDILINSPSADDMICAEVKAPGIKIAGKDVYQCLCYMQDKGIKYGLMVGDDLLPSAKQAINNIENQKATKPNGMPAPFLGKKYHFGFWSPTKHGMSSKTETILKF